MKEVGKQLSGLTLGSLVRVDWFDASIGKSLGGGLGSIDVPVQSWGIFLDVLGEKNKHIILAQNTFRYADGLYDIDYTAVPLAWTNSITTIIKNHVQPKEATSLLNSFLKGGKNTPRTNKKQQKVRNHDRKPC